MYITVTILIAIGAFTFGLYFKRIWDKSLRKFRKKVDKGIPL